MGFIVENENNKYINILYMNNTFKLCYKEKLWSDFTSLYYDKSITIDSLFKLSNSKNLYNNVNNNNTLEFNCISVFKDIKIIIKNNLNLQLSDWEKQKQQLDKEEILLQSYTPETKLEKVINYTNVDDNELKYENGFSEYLLNLSGITDVKNISTDVHININNNKPAYKRTEIDYTSKIDDNDLLNKRVEDFIKDGIENDIEYIKKENSKINIKKNLNPMHIDYTINNNKFKYIKDVEKELYGESYNKLHDRLFDNINKDDLQNNESMRDFMYKEINIEEDEIDDVIISDEEIKLVKETKEQKMMINEDKDIKY
jgi:hypothetical protein